MFKRSHSSLQSLLIGTLIGGTVGATLALLFAPQKGKKLRRDIAARIDDLSSDAYSFAKRAKKTSAQLLEEGLESGGELLHHAYKKAETLIDEAGNLISEAQAKLNGR
jgi:gas vesicle protein